MIAAPFIALPVQRVLGTRRVPTPGGTGSDVATALARALDRLLTATVDADRVDGIPLSIGAAGAQEQALEALALWETSRG